jgi:hypothetical protein
MRLMVFKLQLEGNLKVVVVQGDLQSNLAGKLRHLHLCTVLPRFVVELRFLDLVLVLCAVIRVCLYRIRCGAFLGVLITAVHQNNVFILDAQLQLFAKLMTLAKNS